MFYTTQLFSYVVDIFVPFGDKLNLTLGLYKKKTNPVTPQPSKTELRTRISVAKRIRKKSVKLPILKSLAQNAKQMEIKAKNTLAEQYFDKKNYRMKQLNKMGPIFNAIIPGSSLATTTICRSLLLKNILVYLKSTASHRDALTKVGKTVISTAAPVFASLLFPSYIENLTTLNSVITIGSATTGALLFFDGLSYLNAAQSN